MDLKISNYHKFRCIADQCTFTCCQEWRIGVDATTLKKWQGLKLQSRPNHSSVCEKRWRWACDFIKSR